MVVQPVFCMTGSAIHPEDDICRDAALENDTVGTCLMFHTTVYSKNDYEGGSESSVIGVITLLIDMIG